MEGLREELSRANAEIRETKDDLREIVEIFRQAAGGPTQTVIHRNEGMGAWGSAAVVACFLTYLSLIIFAVWSIFKINNLEAWKDVYGRDLAAMKQQVMTLKEKQ